MTAQASLARLDALLTAPQPAPWPRTTAQELIDRRPWDRYLPRASPAAETELDALDALTRRVEALERMVAVLQGRLDHAARVVGALAHRLDDLQLQAQER